MSTTKIKIQPVLADLIVDDMYYTKGSEDVEFPTYKLHVIVKNVGKKTAKGKIIVKAWQIDETSSPLNFKPLVPYSAVLATLAPEETQDVVWENILANASYCLAVVNLPTLPQFPLGAVKENPLPSAVKNNARGIPGPKAA